MKLIYGLLALFIFSEARAVVGGSAAQDRLVEETFGVRLSRHRSIDTPEIPIGPRVAITCGHCVPNIYLHHPKMQSSSDATNQAYENLTAGTYGLSFLRGASYAYDLALVILPEDDSYPGPYISVAQTPVKTGETLSVLGMGKNTSSDEKKCDGYGENNKYFFADFKVVTSYSQNVGFIVTGKGMGPHNSDNITCYGDSGSYYLRKQPDKSVELVGINSWGTEDGIKEVKNDGGVAVIEGYYSGAGDLTSPEISAWLKSVAKDQKLEICGVNLTCPQKKWPF